MKNQKALDLVKELTQEYQDQGYNLSQSKSLAWADYFADKMTELDYKTRHRSIFFGPEIRIDCYCHDCKEGGHFLPETAHSFIRSHKNHKTRTFARK